MVVGLPGMGWLAAPAHARAAVPPVVAPNASIVAAVMAILGMINLLCSRAK
jgi:hypothetical protein